MEHWCSNQSQHTLQNIRSQTNCYGAGIRRSATVLSQMLVTVDRVFLVNKQSFPVIRMGMGYHKAYNRSIIRGKVKGFEV